MNNDPCKSCGHVRCLQLDPCACCGNCRTCGQPLNAHGVVGPTVNPPPWAAPQPFRVEPIWIVPPPVEVRPFDPTWNPETDVFYGDAAGTMFGSITTSGSA